MSVNMPLLISLTDLDAHFVSRHVTNATAHSAMPQKPAYLLPSAPLSGQEMTLGFNISRGSHSSYVVGERGQAYIFSALILH